MTRQQSRRLAFKARKAEAAVSERRARLAALEKMRAERDPASLPKKHPGKALTSARPYAKPRGKDARSIVHTQIVTGRDGVRREHTFHATKGRRVVRLAA